MPYGSGPLIRQALIRATPWQRYLIGLAMVAVGVVLVTFGHVAGALIVVAGVLLVGRMARNRLRQTHKRVEAAPGAGNP